MLDLIYMEDINKDKAPQPKYKQVKIAPIAVLAFLLGAMLVITFRFVVIRDTSVHYHANLALYINDQKDEFKNFTFYEEVAACSANDADNVKARAHMHDSKPGLIHVHAAAVTWGQFFSNLGYTLGNKVVVTDAGVFANETDGNKLTFMLNGQNVETVESRIIKSEDTLLVSYGKDDDKTLQEHYKTVPSDAHRANTQQDPATCSGSRKLTFTGRLKQAIGFNPKQ